MTGADASAGLDQFYTKPRVARDCYRAFELVAKRAGSDLSNHWFVEPAAGCGSFYQALPPHRRTGVDIDPRQLPRIDNTGIIRADYLTWQPKRGRKYAVIGNPPFGKRGRLAVAFFNHSTFAEFIAFVVPVSFRKYTIHRQLSAKYALLHRKPLANESFCTPDGKGYAVNAEFQVWTRRPCSLRDLRETTPAAIHHPDFEMRQYNNTKQALKMFDLPFDFAVPCQGYQDYARRESDAGDCEKHKQWILFTANNKPIRNRLLKIDYAALAQDCATAIPGFRKNDVVKHYASLVV